MDSLVYSIRFLEWIYNSISEEADCKNPSFQIFRLFLSPVPVLLSD
ncbi:Hypothetical protein RY67_1728 [Bifidobacterium longum subsp. infantis]|uniref:Uncharacterized protein n=1 Tax=Bifidobacterium longum subsp. infantis TaxID=1682 RepID=A0A0M5L248_BIFLI|nr:Hypothetical protein RY67_1728 [Bifidobacterium longum subsp. infantis]